MKTLVLTAFLVLALLGCGKDDAKKPPVPESFSVFAGDIKIFGTVPVGSKVSAKEYKAAYSARLKAGK